MTIYKKNKLFSIGLIVVFFFVKQSIAAPGTFGEAKKLATQIYQPPYNITFYCGCTFSQKIVDLESCGYRPRKNPQRASRLEWEHVVPAWVIGHQRQCWKDGGRSQCAKSDPVFRLAEADLHNLVPAIGEVNGDRSNYRLGMLAESPFQYGACKMVINFKQRVAMPPEAVRGAVARIYLYMADRYQLVLSDRDRKTYQAWHKMHPVTGWERWRNQQVGCIMGWGNHHVGRIDLRQCQKE